MIRAGEFDQKRQDDGPHQDIPIAIYYGHEHFNPERFTNDIALLLLKQAITYNCELNVKYLAMN